MKSIRYFHQISEHESSIVGGKASKLAILYNAGFNVPKGFVITTEAFSKMTPELEQHILSTLSKFNPPFAVRSSATAEDLATASFAGQYDTFLNVENTRVIESIQKCWASLNNQRAIFYRKQKNITSQQKMAVIVQEMVQPDFAGICFTLDPINKKQILIETAQGLGDKLVSGEVTPNDYFFDRASMQITKKIVKAPEPNQKVLTQLAQTSLEIENYFRAPQDIEFAVMNGEIFILQSRPITS